MAIFMVNAKENGHSVYVLSHLPESAWPKGNLYPSSSRNLIANNLYGQNVRYVNLPPQKLIVYRF